MGRCRWFRGRYSFGDAPVGSAVDDVGDGSAAEAELAGEFGHADLFFGVASADGADDGVGESVGAVHAVDFGADEPEVLEAAVGFAVVDVVDFKGMVDGEGKDAVGGDPDCPVFADVDADAFDDDACFEVAVGGYAEGDESSGSAAGDLAVGEVVDPFAGCVFVPCGVVACVEDGGGAGDCGGFGGGEWGGEGHSFSSR